MPSCVSTNTQLLTYDIYTCRCHARCSITSLSTKTPQHTRQHPLISAIGPTGTRPPSQSAAMSLAFLPYLASRGQHAHTRGLRQVIFLPVSDIVIIFPTSRLIVSMPNRRDFIHPHTTRLFSLYRSYHGHLDAVDKYLVVGGKWYLLGKNGGSINWSLEALPSPAAQWSVQPLRSWANEEDRTNRRLE